MFRQARVLAVIVSLGLPGISHADDRSDCAQEFNDNIDTIVDACTKLIASGKYRGQELAGLHNYRGAALAKTTGSLFSNPGPEHDRAIADFTTAIKLNPKFGSAYYNRGVALTNKGSDWLFGGGKIFDNTNYERAVTDLSKAIAIDPKLVLAYYW